MSNSTLILIIVLFFFTGGLLVLALNKSFYNPKSLSQPTQSIKSAVAETSLLFGNLSIAYPIELGSKKSPVYSLPILINTQANKVTAVQLELAFDPNILTNVNITPAAFFKNPNVIINKINSDTGRISYALTKTASESAKKGKDMLATLTFNAGTSSVSSAITFLPRTFVTAEGLGGSALKSTNSAKLKFGN